MTDSTATLTVVGVPLDESAELSAGAVQALREATVLIGESRGVAFPFLKRAGAHEGKEVFLLDPPRDNERQRLFERLEQLAREGGRAALFSDTGMPMLFDPGADVLRFCQARKYAIRSVPGPTSWGTACALCAWEPPFFLAGFPPRDGTERRRWLEALRAVPGHGVVMDTPYRYRVLLKQSLEVLGPAQEAFVGWELAKPEERLLWGSLSAIERESEARGMEKGEFVLILRKETSFPPNENSSTPSGRSSSWPSRSGGSGGPRHKTRRGTSRR